MKKVYPNGLSANEAIKLQKIYGKNEIKTEIKVSFVKRIFYVVAEPVFVLLILAAMIYFLLGEAKDGLIMLIFILGIIIMDVLQEWKTDKALSALKSLSQPMVRVVRDGEATCIAGTDIVPGDIIFAEEGGCIPADGYILSAHDFCMDESLLTGEAREVWKVPVDFPWREETFPELEPASLQYAKPYYCYAGTMVLQGSAVIRVDKTGNETVYGKIGLSLVRLRPKATPLQKQMKELTKNCTMIAAFLFILVSLITFFNLSGVRFGDRIIESFLSGIVLTLSMVPAEFPVILTVFLSMGALRMTKKHALVRKLSAVETLGALSVICVDKTGTITQNKMKVQEIFQYHCEKMRLLKIMALACDEKPHDPMERAILSLCREEGLFEEKLFDGIFIKGYPFTQECKTMSHVWKIEDSILVAAKGSPEWLLEHSNLEENEKIRIEAILKAMFLKGLRVLGIGVMEDVKEEAVPSELKDCRFTFCGLVGMTDPPKDSIQRDIKRCLDAGLRIVMITGDNGDMAASLAKEIDFPYQYPPVTGHKIDQISDEELKEIVKTRNIFSRVIPDQKLRIVKAITENGEITAMTGDGVNDAPAVKCADIGIAMGLRGCETVREAADLILLDDNFSTIVDSIEDGRRIYDNIKKAIGYVFTIHIPIALICLFGPLFHIDPDCLMLLPLHVVLLELIMNPTCAAAIERQPAEKNIMKHGPRNPGEKLMTKDLLLKSFLQGLILFLGSFGSYYGYLLIHPGEAEIARTIGIGVLILSNLGLIPVNASEEESCFKSIKKIRKEKGILIVLSATFFMLLLIIYGPFNTVLKLKYLKPSVFFYTILVSFLSVFWYELVKIKKYSFHNKRK